MNSSPEAIEAQEELAFQRETQRSQAANALAHQRAEVDRVKAIAACWWLLSLFIATATIVGAAVAIKVAW
jgi:hypothetical protein